MKISRIGAFVALASVAFFQFQLIGCLFSGNDSLDEYIGKSFAFLVGQKFENLPLPDAFSEYANSDRSNEKLGHASIQEIITHSGFEYERHLVTADDGYITSLFRIVNPLADRSALKQPPVMLFQGGITCPSIWIFASCVQHHPEKYPRVPSDGPITSWNRSLAFVLANNGYDVWLIGTRGTNENNQGHTEDAGSLDRKRNNFKEDILSDVEESQSFKSKTLITNEDRSTEDIVRYWNFTMDEVANFEIPRQMDKVLSVTGSSKVTFVPMSFSTIYAVMGVAANPEYQKKIHNSVVFGPIINNKETNLLMGTFHVTLCKWIPHEVGSLIVSELLTSQVIRNIFLFLGERKSTRYGLLLHVLNLLAGPSTKYQTLLEPAVYGHILMPTGWKLIKHYCQIVTGSKTRHFDYGMIKNKLIYGRMIPPKYNFENVNLGDYIVVSGENDVLATKKSVEDYINRFELKPFEHIKLKGYNHLDLWAAIDNDVKVNLPVLAFLDNFQMQSKNRETSTHHHGHHHYL